MRRGPSSSAAVIAAAMLMVGCGSDSAHSGREAEVGAPAAVGGPQIDSALPIEEHLRRFRQGLRPVAEFGHAARTREALVDRLVAGLRTRDTAALAALTLDRAEFAYLYYPVSPISRPPYELEPGLLWLQLRAQSGRGLSRALARFGGRDVRLTAVHCDRRPARFDGVRVWSECLVALEGGATGDSLIPLPGPIVELNGRFKFLSHANGL